MEKCRLLYAGLPSTDSGTTIYISSRNPKTRYNYWNPESELHLQGTRNPRSTDMDSRIQFLCRNPDFIAWNPEFKTVLKVPYIGRGKKWNSLTVESLPGFWCCIWHWFDFDFCPKRGDTSCYIFGSYCPSVSCPVLPLIYGEKCRGSSGYEINFPLSQATSARKTESTRAVHVLSKYVLTCGQKRERGDCKICVFSYWVKINHLWFQ